MDVFLARHPLIQKLPAEKRAEAERYFLLRGYVRGAPFFEEDDPPEAVYLLRSGLVKAVKYSPRSEPLTMEIIVPGGLFGMVAVLDKKPYPVSAVALRDSEAYRIPASSFEGLMKSHPDFSLEVFRHMGNHLRHGQTLRSLAKEPVEKRIAYALCLLRDSLGKNVEIRREDIAEMVGSTPETAIRTLIDFRKKKLIASGWKKITVLDYAGLKALSGSEL